MQEYFLNQKIYYRANKFKPNRPTLVFIHGLSGSSSAWRPYEQKFTTEYNIVTFDLRGHGRSICRRRYNDYAIKFFADDLYELASALKLPPFILVSHSFGSLVALEFLAKHKNIAKAAIFLAPNFDINQRKLARAIKPLLNLSKCLQYLPLPIMRLGRHVDYEYYKNTGDWNLRRMLADILNTGLRIYLYCSHQACQVNYSAWLNKVNLPALIIHGRRDTIFPLASAEIMAAKIKKAELVILNQANHILVLNNRPEVTAAMENFIKKL